MGQRSANDNNANESYPTLDGRIASTYAARGSASSKKALYDSYIRAFRWASDRIGEAGVVCFVSNAGWLDGAGMDGMRRCLAEEFTEVRVFHLRGNQRTQGEESRREGGKVFGSGSRAPIAITLLVRNPARSERGLIRFHDVGDYLTREQKLQIVARAAVEPGSVEWTELHPDAHGDWLNIRDESFYEFAPLGLNNKVNGLPNGIFQMYSMGVATNRDAWVWNYWRDELTVKVRDLIEATNTEIASAKLEGRAIEYDEKRYSWTRSMRRFATNGVQLVYAPEHIQVANYRPFCKQWMYYDRQLNEVVSQQPKLFPIGDGGACANVAIINSERGPFITNILPDLELVHHGQCFPLYWYEEPDAAPQEGLFAHLEPAAQGRYVRHDAVTDEALLAFREAYPHVFAGRAAAGGGAELSREDLFYYVYGILHSPEYRERFSANLAKELPRVPLADDFRAFSEAGRALAALHLGYEQVEPWPGITEEGDSADPGRTVKMRFGKRRDPQTGKRVDDRTVLCVAERLTLHGIPEEAYGYVVNGKSALDWLRDRYQVRTDPASGIVNDPNLYSEDPRYIVELVERVVTVSMETLQIVGSLPALRERPRPASWPLAWRAARS